jgi:archaellum component FlaF (FlaF/FlaG flagellin family)
MGFSTSAVVVIFTASIMYMAAMFYPLSDMSYQQLQEAKKNSNELWNEKLNTKIVITNWDPVGNNLTVFNNGSIPLNSSKINLIINGTFKSGSSYVVNPPGIWPPRASIDIYIGTGSGKVKIIAENGAADYYRR